jgi:hypothetical protein
MPSGTFYFTGTKALCAYVHSLRSAVGLDADGLNVGIPDTIGSSMRMADVVSEMSALAADITFCHGTHLLTLQISNTTFVY